MAKYAMTASWAVWPPAESYTKTSDVSFPAEGLDGVLHSRSIILGLNPGDSKAERRPWHNFHTGPRHNDHFLAEAFRHTEHWGAYMTDLLAEVNSKSSMLDLSKRTIEHDVAVLAEQFQALGAVDPLVIVIGRQAAAAFGQHERFWQMSSDCRISNGSQFRTILQQIAGFTRTAWGGTGCLF